jgi:hypothetical protein
MIMTRYLGAAGAAVFMLGAAAGYTLGGAEPATGAAHFNATTAASQLTEEQVQRARIVAFDVIAPGVGQMAVVSK